MRCECGFIVIGDFTIIKVHLFRPVYVLIVYYYSTCNNNNNSAFILISVGGSDKFIHSWGRVREGACLLP